MSILLHRSVRWRLVALALAVLLAHVWLLAAPLMPTADVTPAPGPQRALQTRTVTLATASTTTTPAPVAAAPRPPPRAPRAAGPRARPSTAPASLTPEVPTADTTDTLAQAAPEAPPTPTEQTPEVEPGPPSPPPEPTVLAATGGPSNAGGGEAPAVPFAPPPSANLTYDVQVDYRGVRQTLNGSLAWHHDGDRYRLHMAVALPFLGSRVQHSEGRLGRHGLHPQRFSEKTRSERAAHFDDDGARIRYSANTPDVPLLPGHQDRLSVFLQLAGLVHAQPERFPAGHTVHIPTSGVRDSETWTFEVKGLETIALPRGDVLALHLRRLPRKEFDTTVDVWLAPSLGHLPVRMRLLESNGNVADQRLITP